ncbi:serine protease Do [Halogranum amylolyticum]|uniref:Serine protease Do n=1 Tax=Halogranum amylolyticum TaxID=660520 RepID=A0A1H8P728_9EURY|nr:serine protease [Halogranum amylolyticum]SEO37725.1 serine protease Do [Halogranum amylolyticum]
MATRRGFLGMLTGFAGGTALATYTSIPDRYLPPREQLPPAIRPSAAETNPRPSSVTRPEDSAFDEETRERAREVGLATREAVVYLELRAGNRFSVGTGWILDDEHVVTNGHVVSQGGEVTCYTVDGDTLALELVEASRDPDVALLRTDDEVPATLSTGAAERLDRDQPLVQVGHPGSVGNWIISLGRFGGRTGVLGSGDTLRSSVPSAQGNSGSPLVTLDGDVVGLTYASTMGQGRFPGSTPEPSDDRVRESFASNSSALHVPVETVEELVDEWTA